MDNNGYLWLTMANHGYGYPRLTMVESWLTMVTHTEGSRLIFFNSDWFFPGGRKIHIKSIACYWFFPGAKKINSGSTLFDEISGLRLRSFRHFFWALESFISFPLINDTQL